VKSLDRAGESTSRPAIAKILQNIKNWVFQQENLEDIKKMLNEM
jgi:uncharacterized protein YjiS (DUF1127 family)